MRLAFRIVGVGVAGAMVGVAAIGSSPARGQDPPRIGTAAIESTHARREPIPGRPRALLAPRTPASLQDGVYRPEPLRGLDLHVPVPADSPMTLARVSLGRRLFHDPRLSSDRSKACVSCHRPELAFTDGRPLPIGVGGHRGRRNAPALLNRAWGRTQFWDGRAGSLEEQALLPIDDPAELAFSVNGALRRLRDDATYVAEFRRAFGRGADARALAAALASYVRSIVAGNAPVDRHDTGDVAALDEQQRRGLALFRGKADCVACHFGPTFSDERFHNTGVAWREGRWLDPGRSAVTGDPDDRGAFKTPTLREVSRTAPYMHDGSMATLTEVVEFYDRGGRVNPNLDPEIGPLGLTPEERGALVSFLEALSGDVREGAS